MYQGHEWKGRRVEGYQMMQTTHRAKEYNCEKCGYSGEEQRERHEWKSEESEGKIG